MLPTKRWRLFALDVSAAQAHNKGAGLDEIADEIEQALTEVRAERLLLAREMLEVLKIKPPKEPVARRRPR